MTKRSEIGASDHDLPESMPVELPGVQHDDDVSGDGVFDDSFNTNIDMGSFADNNSLPGYAARENGFGPSETIDWQTGEPVAVFASGITNNIADSGVFPTGRGPSYLPNSPNMAQTDLRNRLRETPIYNQAGILPRAVPGPRGKKAALTPLLPAPATSAPALSSYAPFSPRGLTIPQALMQRQILPVGRIGTMDLVARRYTAGLEPKAFGADDTGLALPDMPLWQWALVGVGVGAVAGALAAVAFPKKGR